MKSFCEPPKKQNDPAGVRDLQVEIRCVIACRQSKKKYLPNKLIRLLVLHLVSHIYS